MSVAGVVSRASNAFVILDILLGNMTLGLCLAITHVSSRTSFALIIFDVFFRLARDRIAIAGPTSETRNALVILDVLIGLMALGLRVAVTHVTRWTSFALIIFDIFGHTARALRFSIVGPARWTVLAFSASLRVDAFTLAVASAVACRALVHV